MIAVGSAPFAFTLWPNKTSLVLSYITRTGKFSLSSSEAGKQAKQLAVSLGHVGQYGETSAKRTGVTEALRNGVSIDTLQQVGQWKNSAMPLYYLQNSNAYKVKIYKQMNLG